MALQLQGLRLGSPGSLRLAQGLCTAAAMPQYVRIDVRPGAFALVLLEREPVNLMDLTMWQQLMAALDQLEADKVIPLFFCCPCFVWCHTCRLQALAHATGAWSFQA